MSTIDMPDDWSDACGWDAYYRQVIANRVDLNLRTGSITVADVPRVAESMKSTQSRSIWIPGCGISPLGFLLAQFGMNVVVTDVSAAAIEFQLSRPEEFERLAAHRRSSDSPGLFAAEVHDFRDAYKNETFDLIINVKAIQGFAIDEIRQIAEVHARALRPGRCAIFDTMNVQGERRDNLEQALVDAGFVIPMFELNRWYRQALRATGIPHTFVLGVPMIPQSDEYEVGEPKYNEAVEQLSDITAQYRSRSKEAEKIEPDAKVAQVIYSTG